MRHGLYRLCGPLRNPILFAHQFHTVSKISTIRTISPLLNRSQYTVSARLPPMVKFERYFSTDLKDHLQVSGKQNKAIQEIIDDEDELSKVEMALIAKRRREKELKEDAELAEMHKLELNPVKKPIWDRIKEACVHYWHGSKLLAAETSISFRLLMKLLKGNELTRRERKQLLRSTADMLRLIPFIIIVIVPFMELALPLILKFFPNALPSTFEDKLEQAEKRKKLLQVRIETAKFFQEAIEEMALESKADSEAAQLTQSFKKLRETGGMPSKKDLMMFAKYFRDDLTLDNSTKQQLVSLCKYMNINAFGTSQFLRYSLRKRFHELKEDDRVIRREGVDSLNVAELQHACQSRGIITVGVSTKRLREELSQWIELRLNEGIPGVLLVLSRAYIHSDGVSAPSSDQISNALQNTLSSLPNQLIQEVEVGVSETQGSSDSAKKLELLKNQETLIDEERKETEEAIPVQHDTKTLTPDQVSALSDAVNILSSGSIVSNEKDDLEELKAERKDYLECTEELKGTSSNPKAAIRLGQKVEEMIASIEKEISEIEKKEDGIKVIQPDFKGEIDIHDLEAALRFIKGPKDKDAISNFFKDIDLNKDGRISIEELEKFAESQEDMEGVGVLKEKEKSK